MSGPREPSEAEIDRAVADTIAALRAGWEPSLNERLSLGLTSERIAALVGDPEADLTLDAPASEPDAPGPTPER